MSEGQSVSMKTAPKATIGETLPAIIFFRQGLRLGEDEGRLVEIDRNEKRVLLLGRVLVEGTEFSAMVEYATPEEEHRVELTRERDENLTASEVLDADAYRFGDLVEVSCDATSLTWTVFDDGEPVLEGASRAEAVHVGHEIAAKHRRAAYERTHGALDVETTNCRVA